MSARRAGSRWRQPSRLNAIHRIARELEGNVGQQGRFLLAIAIKTHRNSQNRIAHELEGNVGPQGRFPVAKPSRLIAIHRIARELEGNVGQQGRFPLAIAIKTHRNSQNRIAHELEGNVGPQGRFPVAKPSRLIANLAIISGLGNNCQINSKLNHIIACYSKIS